MKWKFEGGPLDGQIRDFIDAAGDGKSPEYCKINLLDGSNHVYWAIAGDDEVILYRYESEG